MNRKYFRKGNWKQIYVDIYFAILSIILFFLGVSLVAKDQYAQVIFADNQLFGLIILVADATMFVPFWARVSKDLEEKQPC